MVTYRQTLLVIMLLMQLKSSERGRYNRKNFYCIVFLLTGVTGVCYVFDTLMEMIEKHLTTTFSTARSSPIM